MKSASSPASSVEEPLQQVFLPGFDGQIDKLLKQLVRLPHERLRARYGGVIAWLVQLHRAGEEIRLGVDHVGQLRAVFALDENAHIVARQAQDLPHIGHGADGIQVGLLRARRTARRAGRQGRSSDRPAWPPQRRGQTGSFRRRNASRSRGTPRSRAAAGPAGRQGVYNRS